MLKFTKISQIVNASPFFSEWHGTNQQVIQGACIKTSNQLVKKYKFSKIDSHINSVTLKQLVSYEDANTLYNMLAVGIVVIYQYQRLTITLNKTTLKAQLENLKTSEEVSVKISKTNINKLAKIVNNLDVVDVLQSIYKKLNEGGLVK